MINNCKSFRKVLETLIAKQVKEKNLELSFYTKSILDLYNYYYPKNNVQVEVDSWKGKSSFEIMRSLDGLKIIKYQKGDRDSDPKEIITEVSRDELNAVINAIILCNNSGLERIPTKFIAYGYCRKLNIFVNSKNREMFVGDFWSNFFSDRGLHNKLTLILGALDRLGFIEYKGGNTTILKQLNIQRILC